MHFNLQVFVKKKNGYDRYPQRIICHTEPRFINNYDYLTFLFITLKVQDINYLFLKG